MSAPSTAIDIVRGRRILDSRGRPTVEVDVMLRNGAAGRAAVPSGASTGGAEAHELRDGDAGRFGGRDVLGAIANVDGEIAASVRGMDAADQRELDRSLRDLDGTPNLSRLGANAVLGVSLAAARAGATAAGLPLHAHLTALARAAGVRAVPAMPMPMVNILSGGLHAGGGMDVQDFLAVPIGASEWSTALDMLWRVREAANTVVARRGLTTLLADEGGLSPGFRTPEEALATMVDAIEAARLRPGRDVAIAIDMAANGLWDASAGSYHFARAERRLTEPGIAAMIRAWVSAYPVISVEDALHDEAWDGWSALTATLNEIQLVGDDLFVTSASRIAHGAGTGAANSVLIKLNQNGTLSGTLDAMRVAQEHDYATIVSARSGETEDAFIADLAVGAGGGQIKIGSLRSSERLAKYNQLVRLAETVGEGIATNTGRLRTALAASAAAR
jgi:enolase